MEITEAIIPAPRFIKERELLRALQEDDIPLAALPLLAPGFRLPDQLLQDGRIVATVVIRQDQRHPEAHQPSLAMLRRLRALERRARESRDFRHNKIFWRTLRMAKQGYILNHREQHLLQLAWARLQPLRDIQPVPAAERPQPAPRQRRFPRESRALTLLPPAYAAWLARLDSAAPHPQRRPDQEFLEPIRGNWMPKLRPHFTDTDSGDEG